MAKKGTAGRPSLGDREHVGCMIPRDLYDRLEAFRAESMANRAALIQRAIEEYLDRKAPVKASKAKA